MAKNWTAYEAAVELYGTNKENIAEIGSRYPLFTRTICMAGCMAGNEFILDILKALSKVTARVVETGLKEMEESEEPTEETTEAAEEKAEKKSSKKASTKKEAEADEDDTEDYESMTAQALYKLCCSRGISSHCKSRSKAALIEVLEKHDRGELESTNDAKKEKTKPAKKSAPKKEAEPEEDDWDEEEEDEEKDPYVGKTAMELYKECKKRGIKAKPKMKADDYAKLLKEDDEAEEPEDEDIEDDEDEWEI